MAHDPYADFPGLGLTPWYTEILAWATSVETAVDQVEDEEQAHIASAAVHVPAGGSTGQALVKTSGVDGATGWATPSGGGVTDHGALTGLNDPDHAISAVINLQTTLDGKSAVGHTHSYEATGVAASLDAAHVAAGDPHTQYMTPAEAAAVYAPLARGIPAGGTSGQILAKTSGTDYATGWVASPSPAAPLALTGTVITDVPLTVKGASGQTANILATQLTDGTNVMSATAAGEVRLGPGTTNTNGTVRIGILDPLRRGINLRMATGQSALPIRIESDTGVLAFSVGADGLITGLNIDARVTVLSAVADASALPDKTVILRRP